MWLGPVAIVVADLLDAPATAPASIDMIERTPKTHPEDFESVRGRPGKRNKNTGEIWEIDKFHKHHYEVYKNMRKYEKRNGENRDRAVWDDGRLKEKF